MNPELMTGEIRCKRLQFQSETTNPGARSFYKAMGYRPADMFFYIKYLKARTEDVSE